jgi:hypothetical protein
MGFRSAARNGLAVLPARAGIRRRSATGGDFGWRVRWLKNGNIEATSGGGFNTEVGAKRAAHASIQTGF